MNKNLTLSIISEDNSVTQQKYHRKFIFNLNKINKFINDNNLEKGIVLINEQQNKTVKLRQIKFITNDISFTKKVNINEIQDYLFHSSNEININFADNNLIHVYFNVLSFNTKNTIEEIELDNNSNIISIHIDIYNINCCDILNIKKSLSIFYTIKNIKENSFSIKSIKKILDIILINEELINLVHISYDNFIKKINELNYFL